LAEATVERVRQAYGLVRRGNPLDLLELMAPDAVWETVEGTRACEGRDQLAKTLLWRGAVHRLRATSFVDVGDRVVVTVAGTRMGRLGAPWWAWRIFQVVTVRDGKISRIQDFPRRTEAFAAVGLKA
jgi:ketosteroid isomerase-like protein